MNTKEILANYLRVSGVNTHLGTIEDPLAKAVKVPTADDAVLVDRLNSNIQFNRKLVVAMYILLAVLFVFCIVLIEQFKDSPKTIRYLFGGSIFSILAIVAFMRRIWLDKMQSEFILAVVPTLEKAQKLKIVLEYLKKDLKTTKKI